MKKLTKIAIGITMSAAVAATCGALAGCSNGKTGEAYGLVHSGGYVGYSKIVLDGDTVKDLTLTEVCLPTQVKANADVAAADKVGDYYKTVSYGTVTLTYSADANDYMVDSTAFKTYLRNETNAKAYYDAVVANSVKVTVGGQQKTDIMNYSTLSKEENGYWSTNLGTKLGWKVNRDKTVDYVKANGVGKLSTLAKDGTWKDSDGVDTGATWSDMNTQKENTYSYVQLILKACDAAK